MEREREREDIKHVSVYIHAPEGNGRQNGFKWLFSPFHFQLIKNKFTDGDDIALILLVFITFRDHISLVYASPYSHTCL